MLHHNSCTCKLFMYLMCACTSVVYYVTNRLICFIYMPGIENRTLHLGPDALQGKWTIVARYGYKVWAKFVFYVNMWSLCVGVRVLRVFVCCCCCCCCCVVVVHVFVCLCVCVCVRVLPLYNED